MYKFLNSFVLRTPLLPLDRYKLLIKSNKDILAYLRNNPIIMEAIYLASPTLYREAVKLIEGKECSDPEKIIHSLVRYLSRMSTRCTPFGLFAGCSTGSLGNETAIVLDNSMRRSTRLDIYFTSTVLDTLLIFSEIRSCCMYYANPSIYKVNQKIRYLESYTSNAKRCYRISEVENSPAIKLLLKKAKKGTSLSSLVNALLDKGYQKNESEGFISSLIDSQLLIPDLFQPVIGEHPLSQILSRFSDKNDVGNSMLKHLSSISLSLKELDTSFGDIDAYKNIKNIIENTHVPYEEKYLFQVDLLKNSKSTTIDNRITSEISKVILFLNKITQNTNPRLKQFTLDFFDRYEYQDIPLLELVDPDIGLGYPKGNNNFLSPLVDGLTYPDVENDDYTFQEIQKRICSILEECKGPQHEISLFDDDFKDLKVNWQDIPPSIIIMFEILDASIDNLLIKIKSCGGSCGANLISRFAHADSEINRIVDDIISKENDYMSGVIVAEIVHCPDKRVGNILQRPHLREYEIPILSSSDIYYEHQIPLSDLFIRFANGKLTLRSRKFEKEVIPRLTNAHNYTNNTMPIYQLLCDMQVNTGRNSLTFSWDLNTKRRFKYIPRIKYSHTILAPAVWFILIDDFGPVISAKDDSELLLHISMLRKKASLPNLVLLEDYDNQLLLNFESIISIRSVLSIIKNKEYVCFTEFLFDQSNSVVTDVNGNQYTNEFLMFLYKDNHGKEY